MGDPFAGIDEEFQAEIAAEEESEAADDAQYGDFQSMIDSTTTELQSFGNDDGGGWDVSGDADGDAGAGAGDSWDIGDDLGADDAGDIADDLGDGDDLDTTGELELDEDESGDGDGDSAG